VTDLSGGDDDDDDDDNLDNHLLLCFAPCRRTYRVFDNIFQVRQGIQCLETCLSFKVG
jgi:hypothetical protein